MSCGNCDNCICVKVDNVSQCEEVLTFDLGILNAERDLKFNITGRSKRIYQIDITTDSDGIASVDLESLPVGYISIHYLGFYEVYFIDSEIILILWSILGISNSKLKEVVLFSFNMFNFPFLIL